AFLAEPAFQYRVARGAYLTLPDLRVKRFIQTFFSLFTN
ncbi:hypothetical protein VIS19158_14169, partial [Vibrio scophthalmi LMG 19158]